MNKNVVHLLFNPAARKGTNARKLDQITSQLKKLAVQVVQIRPDSASDVAQKVSAVHKAGMKRLIIVGGDGIIHHALPAVALTNCVVGIIPLGTGNDFARALGIPSNTEKAVTNALCEGIPVDLIRSDQRWAATVVTGGWSGDVNARADRLRFPRGQQRYTVATLLELTSIDHIDLQLDIDGNTYSTTSTLFAIGNTAFFGGGMKVCPAALPNDGTLQIAVLEKVSAFELIPVIPKIFTGKHIAHPKVKLFPGAV